MTMSTILASEGARQARSELGVGVEGPLPDLLSVIEEGAGAAVAVLMLPRRILCAYARRDGQCFIFLNGSCSLEDQRFALAHAFGHHALGHEDIIDFTDDDPEDPKEAQANGFAAEFLAPLRAVDRSLSRWNAPAVDPIGNPETFTRLARYFGISDVVALQRLASADRLLHDGKRWRSTVPPLTFSAQRRPAEPRRAGRRRTDEGRTYIPYSRYFEVLAETSAISPLEPAQDNLSAIQANVPRMPSALQANAAKAYAKGAAPLERLAAALRRDPDELAAAYRSLGLAPAEPGDEL